jgi:hypothetical protein
MRAAHGTTGTAQLVTRQLETTIWLMTYRINHDVHFDISTCVHIYIHFLSSFTVYPRGPLLTGPHDINLKPQSKPIQAGSPFRPIIDVHSKNERIDT